MSGFHGLAVGSAKTWLLIVYCDGTARHNVECLNLNKYSIVIVIVPSAHSQIALCCIFGLNIFNHVNCDVCEHEDLLLLCQLDLHRSHSIMCFRVRPPRVVIG